MRGKVVPCTPATEPERDHPRLCGEKARQSVPSWGVTGSPPPMRGKGNMKHYKNLGFRITPAYAGKSKCRDDVRTLRKDHPRLCGEKHQGLCPRSRSYGITPAYAGKSRRHLKLLLEIEDHPRLCGEKFSSMSEVDIISGSPPPMRGKVRMADATILTKGITPAYAGKSHVRRLQRVQSGDHPRLCGEKPVNTPLMFSQIGSPPPMRGKARKTAVAAACLRITPAYAGKRRRFCSLTVAI